MPVVPGTLNYHDPNSPDLVNYHVIIAGRSSVLNNPFYKTLQASGHRIVQYVDWVDLWTPGPFDQRILAGVTGLPTNITNWGGKPVIDYGNPANITKIVEAMKWVFDQPLLDDVMCDVFGTRLWSSAWTAMTASQRDAYANGARVLADKLGTLRDSVRPDLRMYANGTWNGEGNKNVCPAIENHDSEIDGGYWQGYLKLPWDTAGQPCGIVYTKSLAAAKRWATVAGVGVVCVHPTDYYGPSGLYLPYAKLTPRAGSTTPPPPPTVDWESMYNDAQAQVVDLTWKLTAANAKLEAARAALA